MTSACVLGCPVCSGVVDLLTFFRRFWLCHKFTLNHDLFTAMVGKNANESQILPLICLHCTFPHTFWRKLINFALVIFPTTLWTLLRSGDGINLQTEESRTLHSRRPEPIALLLDPNHRNRNKLLQESLSKSLFSNAPRAPPKFAGSSLAYGHRLSRKSLSHFTL